MRVKRCTMHELPFDREELLSLKRQYSCTVPILCSAPGCSLLMQGYSSALHEEQDFGSGAAAPDRQLNGNN